MSDRPVSALIADILESIAKIKRYTAGLPEKQFLADEKSADAVVRNLEIIGEAANHLPENFKNLHPQVAWTKIVGLRHRIVHDYFGVDLKIIWRIVRNELPLLKKELLSIQRARQK